MKFIKQFLVIGILGLLSQQTNAITLGTVYHDKPSNDANLIATTLKTSGFKHVRLDIDKISDTNWTATPRIISVLTALKAQGIAITAIIHTLPAYQAQAGTCPGNLASVTTSAYDNANTLVRSLTNPSNGQYLLNPVTDTFEMENEISLYPNVRSTAYTWPYSDPAAYNTACGQTMVAVLKGIAQAITDFNTTVGNTKYRTILGMVSEGPGFLTFMTNNNVPFNIVGGHIYPNFTQADLNTGSLFDPTGSTGYIGVLKKFGLPIHINEFNCGEIYGQDPSGNAVRLPFNTTTDQGNYDNVAGSNSMNFCIKSLQKHIPEITSQSQIELLDIFELFDEPGIGVNCNKQTKICGAGLLTQNPAVYGTGGNPSSGTWEDHETRFGLFYSSYTPTTTGSGSSTQTTYSLAPNTFSNPKPILDTILNIFNPAAMEVFYPTMFITLPNGAVIPF